MVGWSLHSPFYTKELPQPSWKCRIYYHITNRINDAIHSFISNLFVIYTQVAVENNRSSKIGCTHKRTLDLPLHIHMETKPLLQQHTIILSKLTFHTLVFAWTSSERNYCKDAPYSIRYTLYTQKHYQVSGYTVNTSEMFQPKLFLTLC